MNIFVGLMIPFLGTTLGSAMVFLMKNKLNKKVEKNITWVCIRCYDCSFCMVIINTFNRYGNRTKKLHLGFQQQWDSY